uniref:mRNA interferase YafQ n=1 Tax=Candidatus Kentrum sp. LPFa TaxID=2126335 RepID=A0A450WU72_9GAMM|nr:MAG: mRNA interferase YafQ [Candidatus Kentron sp. LPFa]
MTHLSSRAGNKQIKEHKRFRQDLKRVLSRGYPLGKLKTVVSLLLEAEPLQAAHRDHALKGHYTGARECHIAPDWLLVYRVQDDVLHLLRTGSHADLF